MTIEQLLQRPIAEIKAMSEVELTQHLSIYFNVTRPELQAEKEKRSYSDRPKLSSAAELERKSKLKRAAELAKLVGVELDLSDDD